VIPFLLKSIWRLVVLALGVGLAYAAAFIAFPYLDKRLPFFFALLVVYVGIAYFGLPALIRFWRVLIKPNHIPLYVTTRDGIPSDPVNIALVARSKHHLIRSMKKAGWQQGDKETLATWMKSGWAMLLAKPYPTAPLSSLYLFNRKYDVGFQVVYGKNGSPRHRHHVRFWELIEPREKDHGHFRFWMRHFTRFISRRKTVWIGAATDDNSVYGIRWFNLQPTHRSHPEPQRERDYIIESLRSAGLMKFSSEVKAGKPFTMRAQSIGNSFICDGKLRIVELN
jgi:hypothetical protein